MPVRIQTNERFDTLTNLDISTYHKSGTHWLDKSFCLLGSASKSL